MLINYDRQNHYFRPDPANDPHVTVIGCGSLGGNIAIALSKLGLTKFTLYDYDTVEAHNVPNQPFSLSDIGDYKSDVIMSRIADNLADLQNIKCFSEGWNQNEPIEPGILINTPDCIDVRKAAALAAPANTFIIDGRMAADSSNLYACYKYKEKEFNYYLSTFFDKKDVVSGGCGAQSTVFGNLDLTAMAVNIIVRRLAKKRYPSTTLTDLWTLERDFIYLKE